MRHGPTSMDYLPLLPQSDLGRQDIDSRTLDKLMRLLEVRLAQLREENDQRLDEVKTATIRGRIAELKALLAIPDLVQGSPAASGGGSAFDAFPSPSAQ